MPTNREKLHELRRRKSQLATEFQTLARKEADLPEDETLPEGEAARLTAIEGEIETINGRIARIEQALELEADTTGNDNDGDGDGEERGAMVPAAKARFAQAKAFYPDQKGWKAARFLIGCLHAKTYGWQKAAEFIQNNFGDADVAKALNTTGVSTGGALIPQAFMPDLIELLRARVVIRELDPTIVPMPSGNLTIPRLAAGATAGYQGELDDIATSQQTFDDLQLNAKKLTALVPVSNDLIRRAPIGVENIVRDDLVMSLARREDIAFLRGDGSGNSPIGLLNLAAAANKLVVVAFTDPSDAGGVLNTVVGVVNGMRLIAEQGMSRMLRPAWIFSPQIEFFLRGLRDQVGNFVFKDEIDRGTFMGIRYATSQQLPTNLTTTSGANGTEIYLVDMADIVLGETYNVSVDASDVASYKDGGGNMVSAFQRDQTLFRVISEHDLNVRHQSSIIVATVPAWAPAGYAGYGAGNAFFVQALTSDMSAAPSTWGVAAPTGSNNPGNSSANVPGGLLPGRP